MTIVMFARRTVLSLVTVLLSARGTHAQSTKAELFGRIRDQAGLPLGEAAISVKSRDTGRAWRQISDREGAYRFLALVPGRYELHVEREGFTTLTRDIVLRVGEQSAIDFELRVAGGPQSVEVTAAAPLIQSTRGTVSLTVDERKVVTLPLDGRNFVPLVALSPGVNLPPGSTLPRINGSRPRVSEYIYDGISVLQPEPGQVAYFPIIDAIEEFRVETNSYSAEYGRSNGGVIMVNQKAGSNALRGTLFEFFRNDKLNGRNLFSTSGPKPAFRRNQYGFVLGGPVQKNRTFFFVDWQGTRQATGVVRQSTVPLTAQRSGVFTSTIFDPATTSRDDSGAYSRRAFPGNRIPVSRFDRATLRVLERYPTPNVFTPTGTEAAVNNYLRTAADTTAADQFDGRLDRYFGARHRLFGRYTHLRDSSLPATPLAEGSGTLTTGVIADTRTRADSIAAEHSWNVSAAAVNQLRFGYTRRRFGRSALRLGRPVSEATAIPNLPAGSFPDVLPTYDVVGLQQLGPAPSSNADFSTSVTQVVDNYSWASGRHSIKAGIDLRWQSLDVLQPPSPTGNFQFTQIFTAGLNPSGAVTPGTGNSFASFLLGQVTRMNLDWQQETLRPRARIAELFVQDDFRVNSRLTLNAGVRYTLNFPSTVVGDRGAVFDLRTQRLNLLGSDGFPHSARSLEKANLAPRLGFAYLASNAFVIRGGYGLTWIEQAGITTPFTTPLFPFIQTLSQQSLDNLAPAFVLSQGPAVAPQPPGTDAGLGQGVFGVQRDNGSGYAQQWNLTIQRSFGSNWSIEAGYLGSKLTRLGVPDVNLNQLTVEQLALGASLTQQVANPFRGQIPSNSQLGGATIARAQLLRPYPRFTNVALYRNNIGHSTYHSAQVRVEKRFSRGLSFTLAYTFSRLIDDAGAVFDSAVLTGPVANFQAADSLNKRLEKDVSSGNLPHVFSSGFVYELPFGAGRARPLRGWRNAIGGGWQVAGIVRAQSGAPVAVTQATNLNAFAGFGIQRPNRIADPALDGATRTTARWFNTSAFTAAPQFTIGNSSRNPVIGPGYRTLDVMAGKNFRLSERVRSELRIEAFNVTNTPPLGPPNGQFGTVAFGSITTALDPRVFELVMKIHF